MSDYMFDLKTHFGCSGMNFHIFETFVPGLLTFSVLHASDHHLFWPISARVFSLPILVPKSYNVFYLFE